jgi:DNA polymerase-3 subunit gamma/tau
MLRTHGELGYRQEQRFHLELGLLKMAHAQRLLPIEQLLSDASASAAGPRTTARPVLASSAEVRRAEPQAPARSSFPSPFAADSARKSTPKGELSSDASAATYPATSGGTGANVVIMGSAAPAVPEIAPEPAIGAPTTTTAAGLRECVLSALSQQPILVSMLEAAEWSVEGNSLVAKVAASNSMIEMSFNADARRIASAAASGLAGRPLKMLVQPGSTPQTGSPARRSSSSNGSARSRAEQDPVVRRMQEKFGAEIRTVIDYREKG